MLRGTSLRLPASIGTRALRPARQAACRASSSSLRTNVIHAVQPGESLAFIATQYGVTIEELQAVNNDELKLKAGKLISVPSSRKETVSGIPQVTEQPVGVQSMASASLTIGGLQTALATNALGIQLGTGLLAALALGRVLLQWVPSSTPVPAGGAPDGLYQPVYAISGLDRLLQDAQDEIKQVEGQLGSLQALRQQQRLQESKAAASLSPEADQEEKERKEPEAPDLSGPSLQHSTPNPTLPSSSSSSSSEAATAFTQGPGGGSLPQQQQRQQQQQQAQRFPSFFPFQSSVLPFQEPAQRQAPVTEQQAVPPFSSLAELVVASSSQEQPPPPTPTFPLADPFVGMSLVSLKSSLLDEVFGTARGVTATGRQRAAIEERILALEARNPQPKPTACMGMMEGQWKLVYTTNTQTLMMLNAIDALPLVDIGNVYQVVDAQSMTASNKINVAMPINPSWPVSLTSEAMFEVRTTRAFKVRFTKIGLDTYVQTPQLLAALEIPVTISVLGNAVDLTPLRELIVNPVNAGLETAQSLIQNALNPEIGVQVSELASSWMLTTYLDETLRISRDDTGRVFVMMKDDPLLASEFEDQDLATLS